MSRVMSLTTGALVLWLLGYPEQALQREHEALTLAQELAHPHSLASALLAGGWLHKFRREGQAAQARAEASIALSTEQGFAEVWAVGTIQRGWALTEQGQVEEGITQMRQGLAAHRATGAEAFRSGRLALLAEAHGKAGQSEEGLTVLAEALALVDKTGERYYEAELYRLKGELTLQQFKVQGSKPVLPAPVPQAQVSVVEGFQVKNPQSAFPNPQLEAEECFLKAIDIARKQQAKSLELRAVMSLVRLRQHQVQAHATRTTHHETRTGLDEAHRMLSEIYGWFTEGFETADLKEAKAALQEFCP
jgi:predicted ATPase